MIKQNGEHDLCHVCEHILEGTIAKGVFSSSTSTLSAESESSFSSTMKSLKIKLSKAGLEAPGYFTADFTNPPSSKTGVDCLTNPFNSKYDSNAEINTKLVGKGVTKTKTYKQKQTPKKQKGKESKPIKKVKKVPVEIIAADCSHDGSCDVCYRCSKCSNQESGREKEVGTKLPIVGQRVMSKKIRKECKACGTLHKLYCS